MKRRRDKARLTRPRTRRRGVQSVVGPALVVLAGLTVWGAFVVTAGLSARDDLRTAEAALASVRDAVGDADLVGLDRSLSQAAESLAAGQSALHRVDVRTAAALPWIGDDLRAAQIVTNAIAVVVDAGQSSVEAVQELGGVEALAPSGGRLPTAALRTLTPSLAAMAEDIAAATNALAAAPEPHVLEQVASARTQLLAELRPLALDAQRAADLAVVLPELLGQDRPVRYFLAAANPAESRGTIGFMGSFAIATFDQGRLEIGEFRPIQDLPDVPVDQLAADPSPVFERRWQPFGGAGTWKNLNATPDFPSAARAIEALWRQTQGEQLDGTILVDPFAFEALVRLSGPVELPAGGKLRPNAVVEYVANQAYDDFETQEGRKSALGEVAAAALTDFLSADGDQDVASTLRTLGNLLAQGHVRFHSAQAQAQSLLADLNMDGALPAPRGDFLAVVTNSAANSKVDYYAQRTLTYDVSLRDGGEAAGRLRIALNNDAPADGRPKHVLGPSVDGLEAGDNRMLVSAYCTAACTWHRAGKSAPSPWTLGDGLDHAVADAFITIPRGERRHLTYERQVTDAWWGEEASEGTYQLTYHNPVTIRPTRLTVRVALPEGAVVTATPPGASVEGNVIRWSYQDRGDASWRVQFRPPTAVTDGAAANTEAESMLQSLG